MTDFNSITPVDFLQMLLEPNDPPPMRGDLTPTASDAFKPYLKLVDAEWMRQLLTTIQTLQAGPALTDAECQRILESEKDDAGFTDAVSTMWKEALDRQDTAI